MRQKVIDRDHGCVLCGAVDGLEVHHVIAAELGGDTAQSNLITLCRHHHRELEADKRAASGPR